MAEKSEKKVWISVKVPASMAAALHSIASAEADITRSDVVRRAIRREIEARIKNTKAGKS